MQTPKLTSKNPWTIISGVFAVLVWVMIFGHPAAAEYAASAHGDTSDGVNRLGASYAIGDCAQCHDTFDPAICGVNETMLFALLDDPDFCMTCHTDTDSAQVGGVSAAAGDIASIFLPPDPKPNRHNITAYPIDPDYPHKFSPVEETRTYLSANKHVECNDCHNPHAAEAGLHSSNEAHVSASGNDVSGTPINGAFGVEPTWNNTWQVNQSWTAGGANSWPSTSSTATKEYQICFKCHSDYVPWDDGGTGPASWTNLALEFNPRKQSYHPVVQALPEIDPGYSWDGYYESDAWGSNRLPPAFTSVVIGDSGIKTGGSSSSYIDSNKTWTSGQWVNWGVRFGTRDWQKNHSTHDAIRHVTNNTTNTLSLNGGVSNSSNYSVYSIEYYAGGGTTNGPTLSNGGLTVTHSIKNFNSYVPSLVGYTAVVQEDLGLFGGVIDWVAKGVIESNTATSFTVGGWTMLKGTSVPTSGAVAYYISATGQSLMCSDCHSNDQISTSAAQGPHGSGVKWMLKGRNKAWPAASAASNGAGYDGTPLYAVLYPGAPGEPPQARRYEHDGTDDGLFCLNCHSTVSFSKGTNGLQAVVGRRGGGPGVNQHLSHNEECIVCHVMVPHGSKLSRLIGDGDGDLSGQMPARYAFNNNIDNLNLSYYQGKIFNTDGTSKGPEAYPEAGSEGGTHGNGICVHACHHYVPQEWP